MGPRPGQRCATGRLLGVRRAWRKQDISLAKLRGIAYATEHDFPLLQICTAIQNLAMQALFNKLGFARDPECLQGQKDLHG